MQAILMFEMAGCPHGRLAHKLMDELLEEHPGWKDIPVRVVDERREAALADSYDYYYVPSYYVNGKKVHEGHAEKADVEAVYRAALGETAGV